MRVHLAAVQAAMTLEDYTSAERFHARVHALTQEAVRASGDAPTLVAFPETIGFPLLLTLGEYPRMASVKTVAAAGGRLVRAHWRGVLRAALAHRAVGLGALYLARAPEAYRVYCEVFGTVAAEFGVTLVAGSGFFPRLEHEPSRGLHATDRRVYNTALTFGPFGGLLDRTEKRFLTPLERQAGLSPTQEGIHAFETPLGRVGVALCLDGFYESVLARLDGLGVQVVVQPSANHAAWGRPWPADVRLGEGEAWLRHGLRARLQGCLHVRCGVNPMLVGQVFELAPRGRSSLLVNTYYYPGVACEGYAGVLALARRDDVEEVVQATLEWPDG